MIHKEAAERCPVFPGNVKRIAWSFKDPSGFEGSQKEVLEHTRKVRDEIEQAYKADDARIESITVYAEKPAKDERNCCEPGSKCC